MPTEGCPLSVGNLAKALDCRWMRYGVGVVAVVAVGMKVVGAVSRFRLNRDRATFKQGVVYFYHMPRCETLNQVSPPCQKLEAFLRLARIPHVSITVMDPSVSPTGRLPCIVYNGEVVADSEVIITFLHAKFPEQTKALYSLTPQQHNLGTMVRRLAESSMFINNERASIVDNADVVRRVCIQDLKMRPFTATMLVRGFRKSVIRFLNNHGNGDVPDEQFRLDFLNDVKAVEQLLTDHKYAVGGAVSVYDAALFAAVSGVMLCARAGGKSEAYEYALKSKVIVRYFDEMQSTYYADLKTICQQSDERKSYFVS